eukprot:CAMPEP_0197316890 /NCGR_PEP_ID=MMETSP0891-20130614/44692_1 /TAXON_ID=44058 ORGANISM="Aureoumbra lagunensis, Strain CCMP1510" /NCGR_SAMPLE_ID=MMETSP0891 /ASSEMBLY_ACC=CAM_ASM_000534 /LENGTH=322 /DNA_ID=CAMNT_0042806591 /DNA_START=68 /DNA_END=1036 /DNA_ORIENTATION=-
MSLMKKGIGDEKMPGFFELKCSACVSIVAELERNLEIEKPKGNIDLRRTLSGGDKGKVIDYSVSELRTLELLEELCKGMQHYGITQQEDGTASFQRHSVGGGSVHISGTMKIGTQKYHDDRVKLQSYCDALVEEHEDLLSEAIRSAGLVQLRKREEEVRIATAKRKGLTDKEADVDPYEILGINPDAEPTEIKAAYRRLSRKLHPDKTGADAQAVKQFVALTQAYEKVSGQKHQPYEDLYRQICVEIVQECDDEAQVDYVKSYFPKYYNSVRFQRPDDDPSLKLSPPPDSVPDSINKNHHPSSSIKKKKKRKKRQMQKQEEF